MRRRVYEILTNPRPRDTLGRIVSVALLLLIAANVAANVLETDDGVRQRAPGWFHAFEVFSVAIFTLEYVLRLWSCTADPRFSAPLTGRLRFALRPMALVDLAAIAPFYFERLLPEALDLRFLRALRLLRLFRLFRFGRLAHAFALLTRVIQAKRAELGVTLAVVSVAVLLAAGAIYTIEHGEPKSPFTSIPRAMWWSVVTITTVGYGDMVPATPLGQALGGIVAFLGICALALPVGILSTGFFEELGRSAAGAAPSPGPPPSPGSPPPPGSPSPPALCPHCGGSLGDHAPAGS